MNSASSPMVDCRVVGGDKLPVATGGTEALCAAISSAAATANITGKFSVEVRVMGGSSLAATVTTAQGATLPEQRYAISDRGLTKGSIERFANAIVNAVARAEPR